MSGGATPAASRRWMLWLVPAVAIAAAVLLWATGEEWGVETPKGAEHGDLPGGDEHPHPPLEEHAGDVELKGRPGARAPGRTVRALPRAPRPPATHDDQAVVFRGVVRTTDGRPIRGGIVYLLRTPGWQNARLGAAARAITGGDGRFTLRVRLDASSRFLVVCRGYVPYLSATGLPTDREQVFVLEEAPRLRVRLVDEGGEPIDFGGVRAVQPDRPDFPELGAFRDFLSPKQFGTTNEQGVVELRFPSRDPVVVIPEVEGLTADPSERWLPEPRGEITFTMRAGTLLVITAKQDDGGPVTGPVHVSVYALGTSRELSAFRSAGTDHVADMDLELPGGEYAVEVTVEGREPVLLPRVELPGGGVRVERTVTMAPLASEGVLVLDIEIDEAHLRARGESLYSPLAPPRLILRRGDGGWADLGWRQHSDFQWTSKHPQPEVRLRPGTYDLVLSLPTQEQIAVVERVVLVAGKRVTCRAVTRAAPAVCLYDVLPPDVAVRSMYLESPRFGRLPVIGRYRGSGLEDEGALVDVIHPAGSPKREQPQAGPWLGPYPGAFWIVVEDWRGVTRRFAAVR